MTNLGSISELSAEEAALVDGGVLPLIPIAYVGIGASVAVLTAGYAWIGGVYAGHAVNKR